MITADMVLREFLINLNLYAEFKPIDVHKPIGAGMDGSQQLSVDIIVLDDKLKSQTIEDASVEWIKPMADNMRKAVIVRGGIKTSFELVLPNNFPAVRNCYNGVGRAYYYPA